MRRLPALLHRFDFARLVVHDQLLVIDFVCDSGFPCCLFSKLLSNFDIPLSPLPERLCTIAPTYSAVGVL